MKSGSSNLRKCTVLVFHREPISSGLTQNAEFRAEPENSWSFLGVFWEFFGSFLGVFWEFFGSFLGVFWEFLRSVPVKSVGEPVFCKQQEEDQEPDPMEKFTV